MKSSWRKLLYWIGISLGGLIFLYQLWQGMQGVLTNAVRLVLPWHLALAGLCTAAAFGLQIGAWQALMAGLGVRLSWRQVLEGYSLSLLPRYIPGSVWGYLSRAEWLRQRHQVAYAVSNLGSILEVLLGVLSGLFVTGLYLASRWGMPAFYLALAALGLALLLAWWAAGWALSSRLFKKLMPKLAGEKPAWIGLGRWCGLLALHLSAWACYGLATRLAAQSLGLAVYASWLVFTFMFTVAWLVGFFILFVPSGLGVREVTLAFWLARLAGASSSQSGAAAVTLRLLMALVELFWLAAGWLGRERNHSR
jgi:hypothetical protein